jgi:flagellar motor switch protein FliN
MPDGQEKQLIQNFCEAWNEIAPPLLGRDSTLGLIALREVKADGLGAALAVAATWSSGFIANCAETLPGLVLCLFKNEDGDEIEKFIKQSGDGQTKPGGRSLVGAALSAAATRYTDATQSPLLFGEVKHLDLSNQESRLAKIVGDSAWVSTFSLTIGNDLDTQALMLYAPNGSLQVPESSVSATANAQASAPPFAPAAATTPPPVGSRRAPKREEPAARNLERLLDVELEVIVRFGTTTMPLRDVVRLGTGMMIELNRAVDEPVELLVNNRPLARGEVVVIDGYYGVRITEIGAPSERPLSLISPGGQG